MIVTDETETLLTAKPAVNLLDLAASLLAHKRQIALFGLVFLVCGVAISFLIKPEYEATTEILPPQPAKQSAALASIGSLAAGSDAGVLAGFGSAVQAKSAADLYAVMIAARPDCDALIERFHLEQVYGVRTMADARLQLAHHTTVVSTKEGLITIAVRDTDPARALALAEGYVHQLRVLVGGLLLTEASQRRVFLEGQLAKAQEDLNDAEFAFQKMQQDNKIVSVDLQAKSLIDGAGALRGAVAAKQVEVQSLESYATAANPQLQMAQRQLSVLEGQLAAMNHGSDNSFTGIGMNHVPASALNYIRASRALKYQEGLFDLLSKQSEAARMDEARDAQMIQVIEPAMLPERHSSPRRGLIALASLLLGLLCGTARVFYRNWRGQLGPETAGKLTKMQEAVFVW